jgi:acetate kinase
VRVLAVNAGSTSLKLSVLDGERLVGEHASLEDAVAQAGRVDAVLHRVVHGGPRGAAVLVDDGVVAELTGLVELAPLHQPPALEALARCRAALPRVPHVACFDTAFHVTLPPAARTYALPERLRARVHVYGFHGLSHSWAASRATALVPAASRVLVAHLGGGESLCGVLDGRSVVTTMGFTPLDGLVMATRSGSIDPGAVLWLAQHTDEDLQVVLSRQSGLLGLCGTGDMREVLERADAGDAAAQLALDVYLHRLLTLLGGCVAALGGLDVLVFTGGVGEHAQRVRQLVSARLAWLGVLVRAAEPADDGADHDLTAPGASVRTLVVHAREDLQMLADATAVLRAGTA